MTPYPSGVAHAHAGLLVVGIPSPTMLEAMNTCTLVSLWRDARIALACLSAASLASAQIYVDPVIGLDTNAGTQTAPLQTINAADTLAVSGDVVFLAAGTYGDEQGVIQLGTKELDFVGAGVDQTILRAHSTLTVTADSGDPMSPVPAVYRTAVFVSGTAEVRFRGVTFDGATNPPASGRLHGLLVHGGADVVVENFSVTGCSFAPVTAASEPADIVVRGDGVADPSLVTLRRGRMADWQGSAMQANYDARVTLYTCKIIGLDTVLPTGPSQQALQFTFGAGGAVHRCEITGLMQSGPGGALSPTAIVATDPGELLLEDNRIARCHTGIAITSATALPGMPATLIGQVRRNRVFATTIAIEVADVTGLTISDNAFHVPLVSASAAASDNTTTGNTWDDNNYSGYQTGGMHPIPGGGAIDVQPRAGCDLLGSDIVIQLLPFSRPIDLVVADFDSNGEADFASINDPFLAIPPTVTVGLQTAGSFGLADTLFGAVGDDTIAGVTGEFDGNPGIDIAVIIQPPGGVDAQMHLVLNNGSGVFSPGSMTTLTGFSSVSGFEAADFDGDLIDDVLVSNGGTMAMPAGAASAWINNGTGTFAAVGLPAMFTAGIRDVDAFDATGDGSVDAVVVEGDATTGNLYIFVGDGVGGFPTPAAAMPVETWPRSVRGTDIDNDGDQDILVASRVDPLGVAAGSLQTLINTGGAYSSTRTPIDADPFGLVSGDLDVDTVVGSTRRDVVVLGATSGSLTQVGGYARDGGFMSGGVCRSGELPTAAAFGEFTTDDFPDVIWANQNISRIVISPGAPTALAHVYGEGCPGQRSRVPVLRPLGAPAVVNQPNAGFAFGIENGRAFTAGVLAIGFGPSPVIIPCGPLVDTGGPLLTLVAILGADGSGSIPFALPAIPEVPGLPLYAQAGILDRDATMGFIRRVSLTNGLFLRVGN